MRTRPSLIGFSAIYTNSRVFQFLLAAWSLVGIWQFVYQVLLTPEFKERHQWGSMISKIHWYWWIIAILLTFAAISVEVAYSNYKKHGFVRTIGKRSLRSLGQSLAQYNGTKKILLLLPKQHEGEDDRRERRGFAKELASVFEGSNWEVHQKELDIDLYPHEGLVLVDYAPNNGQQAADYEFLSSAFSEANVPSKRKGTTSMHVYSDEVTTSDFIIYIGPRS